ncbi:MAG TPA: type I methionyl aminopeptidase [Candidatus Binatia bacterium]|nr:type I methionyl aminopeptidase [Candidatus Binatia bacterium]
MSIESEDDLRGLRRAGRIVALILRRLSAEVRPGRATGELGDLCEALLADHGARHAPRDRFGFPGAICISVGDEAVHGVPGGRTIRAGDLVKLDLVVAKDGYVADAAVTVAVPPVAAVARRLATCAARAFARALPEIRAGARISHVGRAIEREARRSGFSVLRDLCGHGVGRDVHEAPAIPNFADPTNRDCLTEGLVIAVEPILASGGDAVVQDGDGWTIRTADGSLAAHHEHTLVVTRGAPIVVTA